MVLTFGSKLSQKLLQGEYTHLTDITAITQRNATMNAILKSNVVELNNGVSSREGVFGEMPDKINFDITIEQAVRNGVPVSGQHWVVRSDTDTPLHRAVGDKFNTVSHAERFRGIQDVLRDNMSAADLQGVTTKFKTARHGEWALMDCIFPQVTKKVTTSKHETEIAMRSVAWSGIAGSCSNNVLFGAIDFFCTNGMVTGEYDKVRRKNTTNFTLDGLLREIVESKDAFVTFADRMQNWADKEVKIIDVESTIDSMFSVKSKQDMMKGLYLDEAATRGSNVWALYSAFTNFSSHHEVGHLRDTGKDTKAVNMWKREDDVTKWVSSNEFLALAA